MSFCNLQLSQLLFTKFLKKKTVKNYPPGQRNVITRPTAIFSRQDERNISTTSVPDAVNRISSSAPLERRQNENRGSTVWEVLGVNSWYNGKSISFTRVKRPGLCFEHIPHLQTIFRKCRSIHLLSLWASVVSSSVNFTFTVISHLQTFHRQHLCHKVSCCTVILTQLRTKVSLLTPHSHTGGTCKISAQIIGTARHRRAIY